jgi:hypothetical protein
MAKNWGTCPCGNVGDGGFVRNDPTTEPWTPICKRCLDTSFELKMTDRTARWWFAATPSVPRSAQQRPPAEKGYVYFVHSEQMNAVKIGRAGRPHDRMADMQVGTPDALRLLGALEASDMIAAERDQHREWSALHIRGEWFRATPELMAYARALPQPSER